MRQQLDIPIESLPHSLSNEFTVTDGKESFRYEVRVWGIELDSANSILCHTKIKKFKKTRFLLWSVWREVWLFSSMFDRVVNWSGKVSNDHRNSLIVEAINHSVLPTDLLLDQLLSPVELQLQRHSQRIMSLRINQNTETDSNQQAL